MNEFEFIGLVSTDDIASVDFVSLSGPPQDDFALDDLYYGTWNFGHNATSTDVVEPAALAMMGGASCFSSSCSQDVNRTCVGIAIRAGASRLGRVLGTLVCVPVFV